MNKAQRDAFVTGRAGKRIAGLAGALKKAAEESKILDLLLQRERLIKKIKRNREIAEKIQPEKYKDLSGYHAALANCQRHAWELGRRIRKIEHRLKYDQLDQFPLFEWELPPSEEVFISKSKIRKLQRQRKR